MKKNLRCKNCGAVFKLETMPVILDEITACPRCKLPFEKDNTPRKTR